MQPHPGGVGGDAEGLGCPVHRLPSKVYPTQEIRVLRLEHREQLRDTSAGLTPDVVLVPVGRTAGPRLERPAEGRVRPVAVDQGVAEQAVEPSHGRLAGAQVAAPLQGTNERALEQILGVDPTPGPALEEVQEPTVVGHKGLEDGGIGIRHGTGAADPTWRAAYGSGRGSTVPGPLPIARTVPSTQEAPRRPAH